MRIPKRDASVKRGRNSRRFGTPQSRGDAHITAVIIADLKRYLTAVRAARSQLKPEDLQGKIQIEEKTVPVTACTRGHHTKRQKRRFPLGTLNFGVRYRDLVFVLASMSCVTASHAQKSSAPPLSTASPAIEGVLAVFQNSPLGAC